MLGFARRHWLTLLAGVLASAFLASGRVSSKAALHAIDVDLLLVLFALLTTIEILRHSGYVDLAGTRLRCEVDNPALNEVLRRLTAAGVRTLTCRPPTLEELFLRQYSDQSHDSERIRVTPAP